MQKQSNKRIVPVVRLSVCKASYIPFKSRRKPHPVLFLAGQWLNDAGFSIDTVVQIVCTKGQLTITIPKEQNDAAIQARMQREPIEIV